MRLLKTTSSTTSIKPLNSDLESICEEMCDRQPYVARPNIPAIVRLRLGANLHEVQIHEGKIYRRSDWEIMSGKRLSPIDALLKALWMEEGA